MTASHVRRACSLLLASVWTLALFAAPLTADDVAPSTAVNSATAEPDHDAELAALQQRVLDLERALARVREGATAVKPAPPAELASGLHLIVDSAQFKPVMDNGWTRMFACQVTLTNFTDRRMVIDRDQITATIGDEDRVLEDLNPQLQNHSIVWNRQGLPLRTLRINPLTIDVPPGNVTKFWIVIPRVTTVVLAPHCVLKLRINNAVREFDLNDMQMRSLGLETERIGPHGCVGIITIHGHLNTLSAQAIANAFESLAESKVGRAIVHFADQAPTPDQETINWLVQSVQRIDAAGRGGNNQFPALNPLVHEFHLVLPTQSHFQAGGGRLHKTLAPAIAGALRTAYLSLSKADLVREIQQGHPLSRSIALRAGGARLDRSDLPTLERLFREGNDDVRQGVVAAWSNFGDNEVLERLANLALNDESPIGALAADGLAGSRFAGGPQRLLAVFREASGVPFERIIAAVARYPRSIWSEPLFETAQKRANAIDVGTLTALIRVGHPRLIEVLEPALRSEKSDVSDMAFSWLANSGDPRGDRLAVEHALRQLEVGPPKPAIADFLGRVRDQRATPLLLRHFDRADDKTRSIQLLKLLGDQSTADFLAARFDRLRTTPEKVAALELLRQFKALQFVPLAGKSLRVSDHGLVTTVANMLLNEGSPAATQQLIAAFEAQSNAGLMQSIAHALSQLGTAEAETALIKARGSNDPQRRNMGTMFLQNLRSRAPGYHYINLGQALIRNGKYRDAEEFFDTALEVNPRLGDAFAGRGTARRLMRGRSKDASADFQRALEIDPLNPVAVTGLALVQINEDRVGEALEYVERQRERFVDDPVFIASTARVYARAAESLAKQATPDAPRIAEIKQQSMRALEAAAKRNSLETGTLKGDPDFRALRDLPAFRRLAASDSDDGDEEAPAANE